MKKGVLLWLSVAVSVLTFGSVAYGQFPTPEEIGNNYTITAGAAFPVKGDLNKNASFIVGVDWYGEADGVLGENAALGLTGDWTVIERADGKQVSLVPLLVNYRQYGIIGGYRVYVNFGVGIIAATDDIPEMEISGGSNFGWTGGLGVDISNDFFAQSRFIGGQNPGTDGLATVELGYRF